jgi:hypothetical protein
MIAVRTLFSLFLSIAFSVPAFASDNFGTMSPKQCRKINLVEVILLNGFKTPDATHIYSSSADKYLADGKCKYVADLRISVAAKTTSCDDAQRLTAEINEAMKEKGATHLTTRMLGWSNSYEQPGAWDMQADVTAMNCTAVPTGHP